MKRSVILLSGGLDSSANLAFCHERDRPVLALTLDYGQRAAQREIAAARELSAYYGVEHRALGAEWLGELGESALTHSSKDVPELRQDELDTRSVTEGSAKAVWVPNRNGVLINIAAAYAESLGADRVVVGFNSEEAATFPDNSMEYLNRATEALALSTATGVQVYCYTGEWDKRRIVAELRKLKKTFPFEKVWSCYEGGPRPCGKCESCRRMARALGKASS